MGPIGFKSPEKLVSRYQGQDLGRLRRLAVALAKSGIFGESVLAKSSKST
jgi:hypothetical protein